MLYEGIFNKVTNIKKAQVILWWLSVDNLYYNSKKFLSLGDYFKWNPVYALEIIFYRMGCLLLKKEFLFSKNISIEYLKERSNLNCYQSEYARNFLIGKGFSELLPLSDYINTEFVSRIEAEVKKREDIVLYNPKKGFEYSRKLMKLAPHIKWLPLQGMNRDQMMATFRKSKLYIDFGFHPGKDRIPREAALNGCCVITGLEGSARFFEDVPIIDEYKIDMKKQSAGDVLLKIEDVLRNYEAHRQNFVFYQQQILREEKEFANQVKHILNLKD